MPATSPVAPRSHLHFFCGKAGAGKSTLARAIAEAEGAVLVSEDVWLARLFGDRMHTFDDYRAFSQRLKTVVGPLVIDLLRAGCGVVLDYPANTRAGRDWMRTLIEQSGAAHTLHFVDQADATCLERIARRNVERPEGSHVLTPELFAAISSHFEAPGEDEGFEVRRHVPAA
jgi:predicted kinase